MIRQLSALITTHHELIVFVERQNDAKCNLRLTQFDVVSKFLSLTACPPTLTPFLLALSPLDAGLLLMIALKTLLGYEVPSG